MALRHSYFHPDEPIVEHVIAAIFRTGSLNTNWMPAKITHYEGGASI